MGESREAQVVRISRAQEPVEKLTQVRPEERIVAIRDVHQKTVVVTAMITQQDGTIQREQRTFSTMTVDLLTLDDWLRQRQIDVIALESTGVYWRPVYTILEEGRTVILVNARHMKAVPGRKTDRHRTANGLPICCVTGCCKPVLFLLVPSERCAS